MFRARKHQFSFPVLAITTLVLTPAAAHADTLFTSPLWADTQSFHACNVVNVSSSAVSVEIALQSGTGSRIAMMGAFFLAPYHSAELNDNGLTGGTGYGFAYCQFAIFTPATPGTIRANMTIFHSLGDGPFQTYATSEAR